MASRGQSYWAAAPLHEVETEDISAEETGIKLTAPASLDGLSKRSVLVFNDDRMVEVSYSIAYTEPVPLSQAQQLAELVS